MRSPPVSRVEAPPLGCSSHGHSRRSPLLSATADRGPGLSAPRPRPQQGLAGAGSMPGTADAPPHRAGGLGAQTVKGLRTTSRLTTDLLTCQLFSRDPLAFCVLCLRHRLARPGSGTRFTPRDGHSKPRPLGLQPGPCSRLGTFRAQRPPRFPSSKCSLKRPEKSCSLRRGDK